MKARIKLIVCIILFEKSDSIKEPIFLPCLSNKGARMYLKTNVSKAYLHMD